MSPTEAFCIMAFLLFSLVMAACGAPAAKQEPAAPPAASDDALVVQTCGRCHDGSPSPRLQSVADLRRAAPRRLIESGQMPPDRRLPADVKAKLLKLSGG